jgi:hypothetical protein
MVAMVRRGATLRQVARRFEVDHATVALWVRRAEGQRLDRVDWADLPPGPPAGHGRAPDAVETAVLEVRRELRDVSPLGEYGATAIRDALIERRATHVPSVRTIGRILSRRGALDRRVRVRRPPPPRGWHLPDVASRRTELDSFDIIEDLIIEGRQHVDVLTGLSLHGGLAAAWPMQRVPATVVVQKLEEHWRTAGLPGYAQFDNDRRFQGPGRWQDSIGRVTRMCLSLGICVVFAPPREHGFQNDVERFNLLWQQKVWRRFRHTDLADLCMRSQRYVEASRHRHADRIDAAPERRAFPIDWRLDLQRHPQGRLVFLRRTDEFGRVRFLAREFEVDARWVHRLVRCDFDIDASRIRFHGLRRADPVSQPVLRETRYELPHRLFWEWRSHPPKGVVSDP